MTQEMIELVQGETGIELPVKSGNWILLKETGYSPVQSLVAAVGACGGYVYQSILEKSRIPYTFERATVAYKRNPEKQSQPLKEIKITFFMQVEQELQERAERHLKLIATHCPVMQSLDPAIIVTEEVVFVTLS